MTWQGIFYVLGLRWCTGCTTYAEVHDRGMAIDGTVHWRNRRVTRPGIYKLLRAIAWGQNELSGLPDWRQVYLLNHEVLELTKLVGVRLPREVFELDRAKLRYLLSKYTQRDRRRMTPSEQDDFRAALRWAARS